jgi:hypothetical protein
LGRFGRRAIPEFLAWIAGSSFNMELTVRSTQPNGDKGMLFRSVLILAMITSVPAFAQTADDTAWINQCVQDNKDEGAKEDVVLKYCTCMNDKMDDDENASITEWEKSHPEERNACEKASGWR